MLHSTYAQLSKMSYSQDHRRVGTQLSAIAHQQPSLTEGAERRIHNAAIALRTCGDVSRNTSAYDSAVACSL